MMPQTAIPLATLTGELGQQALDADWRAFITLAKAGLLPLAATLDELAYPADGRVTLSALAARRALAKRAAPRLPDIPDYQLLPPEQAAAAARHTAGRLMRGLPV